MRASDLIGLPVFDAHGTRRGVVVEIRASPDPTSALVVDGLVVSNRQLRMFGYERQGERGPAPFTALFRLLSRDTRYVELGEVDLEPGRQVRLHRPWHELPTLAALPRSPD